ncbi:MAG: hypothetical protein KY445_02290 [Armatimonadetes bacterium]|nr:hypothetical protein [Armatimonadota bacterium]
MKKLTPLFCLQSTVLVLPLGFLLAGGCGGGGSSNNGGFFNPPPSSPTVITNPTATPDPNAIATPTPTTAPTPTPTPVTLTNFSPELTFERRQAVSTSTSLRLFLSNATNRTLSISVPRQPDGTNRTGETFPALTEALRAFLGGPDQPGAAGVTYVEGSKTWHSRRVNGRNGTVVISILRNGPIPADTPGALTFQLSEVILEPDPGTDASGLLIITGPFSANEGAVFDGRTFFFPTPTPVPAGRTTATKRR